MLLLFSVGSPLPKLLFSSAPLFPSLQLLKDLGYHSSPKVELMIILSLFPGLCKQLQQCPNAITLPRGSFFFFFFCRIPSSKATIFINYFVSFTPVVECPSFAALFPGLFFNQGQLNYWRQQSDAATPASWFPPHHPSLPESILK